MIFPTNVGSNVVQKIGLIYTKEHMSELVYGGTAYESRFTAQHNNKEYFYQNEMSYPSYRLNSGQDIQITHKLDILLLGTLEYLYFQIIMYIHLILPNPIDQQMQQTFMRLMDLVMQHINLKSRFLMNLESKDM